MVARVTTVAFEGIEAVPVDVQVLIGSGKVSFQIVGLPDKAVAESRERVRAALQASGLALPAKRITVNLAPADLPKEGSHYDLPIALCILVALGGLPADGMADYLAIGELGLDGRISPVAGVLPAAIGAHGLGKGLICPAAGGSEAAWAGEDVSILAPKCLLSLVNHFAGTQVLSRPRPMKRVGAAGDGDLADIRGQESAKRALEISAAGGHNMLMVGPPGAGKSMLASRLPSLLPPLSPRELLDSSMIASLAGGLPEGRLCDQRPFRAPHHSASMAAMVGGGSRALPGEVSLAHNGVLFLDELPEFQPAVLDSLRQPLETGSTHIARANHRVCYPCDIQLIAAMNPCRCGRAGEPGRSCARGERCAADYQGRISGPLLDRIDIRIDIPAVPASDLIGVARGETSEAVAIRIRAARALQAERYRSVGDRPVRCNARAPAPVIETVAEPDPAGRALLARAADQFKLSARGYFRVLKVARTLADLDGGGAVRRVHIAEALGHRCAGPQLAAVA